MRAALIGSLLCLCLWPTAEARGRSEMVHPSFSLSLESLGKLLEGMPTESAGRILSAPGVFLDLLKETYDSPKDLLVLVDKPHGLPTDFIPPDLVPLSRYRLTTNKPDLVLSHALMPDLLAMAESAAAEGVTLVLSSAYRSFERQQALFNEGLRTKTGEELEKELARAGHSQHQLGTAMDFGSVDLSFAETPGGKWLRENAWRFGFSLSYPLGQEKITGYSYEPWHYRYISRSAARLARDYFADSQQRFLEFWAREGQALRRLRKPY